MTSFTRYNKVGREAQKEFERELHKDGFHRLHANLYVRYCTTGSNAAVHKERVKRVMPCNCCDISIIMVSDSQEGNVYHSLNRRKKNKIDYSKPIVVEFI